MRCFWHSIGKHLPGDLRDPKEWLLLVVVAICVTFCSYVYNPWAVGVAATLVFSGQALLRLASWTGKTIFSVLEPNGHLVCKQLSWTAWCGEGGYLQWSGRGGSWVGMLFSLSQHLPRYLTCFSSCTTGVKKTNLAACGEHFLTLSVNWGVCFSHPCLKHMRYVTVVCSKMLLASGYTLLGMLANKYQNRSSLVFCGLQLGDFGVLWRCKPQIVMHSPIRMFYVGFLSLWIAWCHMKHQFVLQLSPELQHVLSSLTTFWRPCKIVSNAVIFGSCRIWNCLMSAGFNRKELLLQSWHSMLLLRSERWKWNKKCLPVQLLRGRLFQTHSRTII